ncbi:hypothetical protein IW261DRAFT_1423815 [Armillaria novae-zelandiae]|uniref:Uncharacterized protein n=1 Tax=Armillaria novae-zelandiae TaxID=153914 RepID=A0AA39TXT7_9AGAR|nr:hypothetical protein IW261DRAFT_1423815 [Armillaria novae-zelandiae]
MNSWNLSNHDLYTFSPANVNGRGWTTSEEISVIKATYHTRVVYDTFLGHEDTFTIREHLHHDVSRGNILVVYGQKMPEDNRDGGGCGLFNDWDTAIEIADLAQAWQAERMTGRRNANLKIVYAMLFYGLYYLCHNKLSPNLSYIISTTFNVGINIADEMREGNGKLAVGLGALGDNSWLDCYPFNSWV